MEIDDSSENDNNMMNEMDIFDCNKFCGQQKMFSCELCDQKFTNKLKITMHWCINHGYKLCSLCFQYAFKYDSDRIHHEISHLPFGCSSCEYEFTKISMDLISSHYQEIHESFLCSYCSSVIQPYSKYPEHVEKKHNVQNYQEFTTNGRKLFELEEGDSDGYFLCLMCDKRKRTNMLFGHYMFYHNLSLHSLKKHLDSYPGIRVNGSVLSSCLDNDVEEGGSSLNEACNVCEKPFELEEELTKEIHRVFCQGMVVCDQNECVQVFENENVKTKHINSEHSMLDCKFGCDQTLLKPTEIDEHLQQLHDIIQCFLCNIVNSAGSFKNHLKEKHKIDLMIYEKHNGNKLFRVESLGQTEKQVKCNFCDSNITQGIRDFKFIEHYREQHEINTTSILRNLDRNPIINDILNDKKAKFEEECFSNFEIKSFDEKNFIQTDFDTSKVYCIGNNHENEKALLMIEKNSINCEFCLKKFEISCQLYEHLTGSHGFLLLNVDSCNKCQEDISQDFSEDNKKFNLSLKCPLDERQFVTKDNFMFHLASEHLKTQITANKLIYKCTICDFAFWGIEELRNHFQNIHPNDKIKYCRICRIKLEETEENSDHFSKNHSDDVKKNEKYCCKLCKKEFKKAGKARLHYENMHRRKDLKKKGTFKCLYALCNEFFEDKEDRKMHQIFAHPDEKMYVCKSCPSKFSTKSSLSTHNMIHKNVVNTCQHCGKAFMRRDSFKEHLLIHSDVRLKCSFCEKVFVQRSNLVRHERIHLNDKPYKCSFCEKVFSDKGACSSHEKVHTKTESSYCEVCGKHFARKQKLKYHMRLHTLENVLTCECGKIFSESYSFRKHREIHENREKSLKCTTCGKVFRTKKSKEKHAAEHKDQEDTEDDSLIETKIQCTICNAQFNSSTIKQHLVDFHKMDSDSNWQNYIDEVEFKVDVGEAAFEN